MKIMPRFVPDLSAVTRLSLDEVRVAFTEVCAWESLFGRLDDLYSPNGTGELILRSELERWILFDQFVETPSAREIEVGLRADVVAALDKFDVACARAGDVLAADREELDLAVTTAVFRWQETVMERATFTPNEQEWYRSPIDEAVGATWDVGYHGPDLRNERIAFSAYVGELRSHLEALEEAPPPTRVRRTTATVPLGAGVPAGLASPSLWVRSLLSGPLPDDASPSDEDFVPGDDSDEDEGEESGFEFVEDIRARPSRWSNGDPALVAVRSCLCTGGGFATRC